VCELSYDKLVTDVITFLDEQKLEAITSIDLRSRCSFADGMIIASGRSQRHLKASADKLKQFLHNLGLYDVHLEGLTHCDWVLIDSGPLIIHLFRPEVRELYGLEKMWSKDLGS